MISLGFPHAPQQTQLARETLHRLRTTFRVAKEVGESLGRGEVLQREVSEGEVSLLFADNAKALFLQHPECLQVKSDAFAAKQIDEIGKLAGGWLRSGKTG